MTITPGTKLGLLGANGSGKSTLLRVLAGLIEPDAGSLTVSAPIEPGTRVIDIVRALDEAGVEAVDITRREATLDDVFMTLTSSHSQKQEVAA